MALNYHPINPTEYSLLNSRNADFIVNALFFNIVDLRVKKVVEVVQDRGDVASTLDTLFENFKDYLVQRGRFSDWDDLDLEEQASYRDEFNNCYRIEAALNIE